MWFHDCTFYQIFPFALCGAPEYNDGVFMSRVHKIADWIPHLLTLGVGAVYLCPVFESERHGYDTRDYRLLDSRLGTNAEFAQVCDALHDAGIKVVMDGVFNHVGREFWAFMDVRTHGAASRYRDWFNLDFHRDSVYGDGFWYEGWEGNYTLVKLNLGNPEVVEHLFDCIRGWVEEFGIDGLRLDVAYLLPDHFLRQLRTFTRSLRSDFFLVGEIIHGDYNRLLGNELLDSCTNYECYKGIHSSLNQRNLFEIAYSLNRQFGPEQWTLYKGRHLFSFVDNHDVTRIRSLLREPSDIFAAYALMFAMPGIPCVYNGSEWGAVGLKQDGDIALRPYFDTPLSNEVTGWVSFLASLRSESAALRYGDYRQLYVSGKQLVFERRFNDQRIICAINLDDTSLRLSDFGSLRDLRDGETAAILPPHSSRLYEPC